ncbi:MAG TPA: phosphate ABC transporter permease PstA [Gemmatales bacterium]|nr:phosphate ABC transporter permease PstA [Gemmatales bacterium]
MSTTKRPVNESSSTMPILSSVSSRRVEKLRTSQLAYGQPWVWLFGGTLIICLVMIIGLLFLILRFGIPTFWPSRVVGITTIAGAKYMGDVVRTEDYRPEQNHIDTLPAKLQEAARKYIAEHQGKVERQLIKIGNFELTQTHHVWVSDYEVQNEEYPEWAMVVERSTNDGRFFGILEGFMTEGKLTATSASAAWEAYQEHAGEIRSLVREIEHLNKHELGRLSSSIKDAEVFVKEQELRYRKGSPQHEKALVRLQEVSSSLKVEQDQVAQQLAELNVKAGKYALRLKTFDGKKKNILLSEIVRAVPVNRLGTMAKLGVYFSRWGEFVSDDPRNSNTEGGVFPCIWGTLAMTLIMTLFVVPFGVLAALYLREYAKPGVLVSTIRIAVNNLAGVPSIVFGVFGLGFFCYLLGGSIDSIFFPASQIFGPKYGTGGLLWASLTLALLTVPVVIVATEEALAAVPRSMREGSYGCGASKWQTIWRIVLPRAMPGILTGTILAMARGAGEVAPLMLVGAMKIAPELPIDGVFPFVHPERSFMHLGFHIYDVGFQSPDSEAAKPMVFTTTLLLIMLIAVLNLAAMWLRNRLRRKYLVSQF